MSISELMAAGDPMHSPVQDDMGPPPPVNTTPMQAPPQHQQLQQLMGGEAAPRPRSRSKKADGMTADMKDAVVVALAAFVVLLPNVQQLLMSKVSLMQSSTNAWLINSIIVGVAFYFMKEHVVGVL